MGNNVEKDLLSTESTTLSPKEVDQKVKLLEQQQEEGKIEHLSADLDNLHESKQLQILIKLLLKNPELAEKLPGALKSILCCKYYRSSSGINYPCSTS